MTVPDLAAKALALLLVAAPLPAEVRQTRDLARLIIPVEQEGPLEIRLSDLLPVRLEVEGALEVEAPKPPTRSAGWRVRKSDPPAWVEAEGKRVWRQSLWLEPLAPGDLTLLIAPLRVRQGEKPWRDIAWNEIKVKVTTIITKVDPKQARDITSIEQLPDPESVPIWPWLAAGGLLLGAAGACLLLARRRRRPAPAPRDPRVWSLGQLARLEARGLPEKAAATRFLALLSLVVRGYLEKALALPARRLTTAELIPVLAKTQGVDEAGVADVRSLLERCDLLRFAGLEATSEECAVLAQAARRIIEAVPSPRPECLAAASQPVRANAWR